MQVRDSGGIGVFGAFRIPLGPMFESSSYVLEKDGIKMGKRWYESWELTVLVSMRVLLLI